MLQPVDSSILHEIVRLVETRRKVPERLTVRGREYQITYLEDHQRRLEEALMRYDADRLNMLYGQLASKVKYQLLRRVPARAAAPVKKAGPTAPAAPKAVKAKPSKAKRAMPKQKQVVKAVPRKAAKPKATAAKKGKPKRTVAKVPAKATKKAGAGKRAKVTRKTVAAKRRSSRAARS